MKNILKSLLSKSPFKPLQEHMEHVCICVRLVKDLLQEVRNVSFDKAKKIYDKINEHEHLADQIKDGIRENLSRSLFMPVHRNDLMEILSIQDSIADAAEDVGVLLTIKEPLVMPAELFDLLEEILAKTLETFNKYHEIILEMDYLLEATFSGPQAQIAKKNIDKVAFLEHETDLVQKVFLKKFFEFDKELSQSDFFLISQLSRRIGDIANISEKAAKKIRLILF